MANNYLLFSEIIEDLSAEEMQFFRDALQWEPPYDEEGELPEGFEWPSWYDRDAESVGFDYDLSGTDRSIHFYAEEYGNIDTLAELVHAFLVKFRPTSLFKITYAETCSKMRIGEFGGGALVVSKYGVDWVSAHAWAWQKTRDIARRIQEEKE